jgi:multidrug efflux pump subunit AcrA (membrane-fusion protein)
MPDDIHNQNDRDDPPRLPAPEESQPGHLLPRPQEGGPIAKDADDKRSPTADLPHKPKNRRILYLSLVVFAVLFVIVLLAGWLPRHFRNKDNEKRAEKQKNSKPVVEVAKVNQSHDQAGLVVPGTTIPLTEAFIYGRANGYLKKLFVDIGDHVKINQLLAIIDAPDQDAQVDQARQQVKQAEQQLEQERSQLALATVTVQRYRVLVVKGVFSRQQGDQQEATYASEVANVAADERNVEAYKANLQHAIALQSYEYVRAPFAGVITQRNVDLGALISAAGAASGAQTSPAPQGQTSSSGGSQQAGQSNNAGSSGSTNQSATSAQTPGQGGPLFGIAQNGRLRILVSVPEGYATAIHVGAHVQLAFQEYSGAGFLGDVTRASNTIDANTRTMLTEVQVDNKDGKLIPGMYVVVTFPAAPGASVPLMITGDAVVVRHDTSVVATVVDGKIKMIPVVLGRDFGTSIEILNGLHEGDIVVTDVTDDVLDGVPVEMHETKSAEQKPMAPPPQNVPPGGSTLYGDQGITDRNLQGQQAQQNKKGSGGAQKKPNDSNSGSKP